MERPRWKDKGVRNLITNHKTWQTIDEVTICQESFGPVLLRNMHVMKLASCDLKHVFSFSHLILLGV